MSLDLAQQASKRDQMVGILFVMAIDPIIRSGTFSDIEKQSFFSMEKEVLFSMHTVFRVGDVLQLDKAEQLFQVQLTLILRYVD